jgi:hypothetical protein
VRGLIRLIGFAVGAAAVAGVVVARRRGITFGDLVRLELQGVAEDARLAIEDGRAAARERRSMLELERGELERGQRERG